MESYKVKIVGPQIIEAKPKGPNYYGEWQSQRPHPQKSMEIVNGPQPLFNLYQQRKSVMDDKEADGGKPIKKSQFIVQFLFLNQFSESEPIY